MTQQPSPLAPLRLHPPTNAGEEQISKSLDALSAQYRSINENIYSLSKEQLIDKANGLFSTLTSLYETDCQNPTQHKLTSQEIKLHNLTKNTGNPKAATHSSHSKTFQHQLLN